MAGNGRPVIGPEVRTRLRPDHPRPTRRRSGTPRPQTCRTDPQPRRARHHPKEITMTTTLTSADHAERAAAELRAILHAGALDPQDTYATLRELTELVSMVDQLAGSLERTLPHSTGADDGNGVEHTLVASADLAEARYHLTESARLLNAALQHVSHLRF